MLEQNDIKNNELEKYKILIPAWGKKYVDRALNYCLSSLISPGNIPYLHNKAEVYITFLTKVESQQYYENHIVFKNIPKWVNIEFIWIDDIIYNENYGVTLTCAYARAIIQAQKNTITPPIFIFANADFIFSNNSFLHIYDIMKNGNNGIACPSVRCIEELTLEKLEKYRYEDGYLKLNPEDLMQMSYDSPHITDLASSLNSNNISHSYINHYFIGDRDKKELLGVWFLRFMLVIRPMKTLEYVKSYCDYSFMSQMVSDDKVYRVTDGHDIFMLELSDQYQEFNSVRLSTQTTTDIAHAVQRFSTIHHRENGLYPYWIDINPNIERRKQLLREFHKASLEIEAAYQIPPKEWDNHYYWLSAIEQLKNLKYNFPEDVFNASDIRKMRTRSKISPKNIIWTQWFNIKKCIASNHKKLFRKLFEKYAADIIEIIEDNKNTIILSEYTLGKYIETLYPDKAYHVGDRLSIRKEVEIKNEATILIISNIDDLSIFLENLSDKFPIENHKIIFFVIIQKTFSVSGVDRIENLVDIRKYIGYSCKYEFIGSKSDEIGRLEQFLVFFYWKSGFSAITRILVFILFWLDSAASRLFSRKQRWTAIKITKNKT